MSDHHSKSSRRSFLTTAAFAGATVSGAGISTWGQSGSVAAAVKKETQSSLIKPGQTILFQGDSITDAGRGRAEAGEPNNQKAMGKGYASMAAASLLTSHPNGDLNIYNRGISGNKVHQLASRWEKDCLALKPDVLSILIGVNDIWHGLNGKYDGTVETYENDFRALLKRTQETLPQTTIVICEPFVLKCGAVSEKWFPDFNHYRAAAKKLSSEFKTVFVPFQQMFDDAVKFAPPSFWAGDGVHPSSHGAALMASTWVKAVGG